MDSAEATGRLLGAAEKLYYANGVNAVGMDGVRAASGVSMRRIYQLYPSKQHLVAAYLDARDVRWRRRLAEHVDAAGADPRRRVLAVFDWLGIWFAEPGFRGCAFINAFGELGGVAPLVLAAVRRHKDLFRDYLVGLAAAVTGDDGARLGALLLLVAEGAMTAAAIGTDPDAAANGRAAAVALLDAA